MLTIAFPAYNEEDNIRRFPKEVVEVVAKLGVPFEVLIVDDGSTDATAQVAQSLGAPCRLVQHERNMGLGAAVQTCLREAHGDCVVTMDADLTFSPLLIERLVARYRQGDVDVVIGSPVLAGYQQDIPFYRRAISHIASWVYRLVLGAPVTAVTPIFRLYRAEMLRGLSIRATGFDINAEILFRLLQQGARVAEVPAELTVRIHGESKLDYKKELYRHMLLILRFSRERFMRAVFGT